MYQREVKSVCYRGEPSIDLRNLIPEMERGKYGDLIPGNVYTVKEYFSFLQGIGFIKLEGVDGWFALSAFFNLGKQLVFEKI